MDAYKKTKNSTKEELILELNNISKDYNFLKESFEKLREKNLKIRRELTNRKNELRAMYKLSLLMGTPDLPFDVFFQKAISILPSSYEVPQNICARLLLNEKEYATGNFKATEWKHSEPILIDKKPVGQIEVYYLEQKPAKSEKVALKKERILLKIIASDLSKIIEKKYLEEELSFSEEKFSATFQKSPTAKCLVNITDNYRFIRVNNAFLAISGYIKEEIEGKTFAEIQFYSKEETRKTIIPRLKTTGEIQNYELNFQNIKGESRTGLVNIETFQLRGKTLAIIDLTDITERKKKEKELIEAKEKAEENEIRFKAITENAMEGISLADMDGNYVFVNSAFAQMVGYSKEELLQMSLFDVKPFEERNSALFHILIQNPEKKGGKSSRTKLLRKDNSIVYVNINGILLDIGNEQFALGIVRDVSEIVKWENELIEAKEKAEESENRFRTIAEHSADGITVADMDGKYIYVNKRFCEMSGYSMDELLKMTAFEMAAEPLSKEKALRLFRSNENLSGEVQYFTLRRKDGTTYHTEITGTNIEINKQKLVLGSIRDVSEIIKYQDELIAAKEKAEESDRLKSAFLMNVSHEIRTPMNGILGFINFLDEPNLDEEERRSFIDIVNKSGERLLNTINDIVEISKIEVGDINLVYEETDISELLQFHFNFFSLQAKDKGIDFKINEQVKGTSAIIRTDRQKLDGILMNLIKNAVKFTIKGTIEIGNYIENEKLYFYVSDSGRGIPEDKIETIFERFIQVELGNTRSYEGSGIGLSIVKAYVEALKGDIKVESEVEKGSTFIFSIPYSPAIKSPIETKLSESGEIFIFQAYCFNSGR